jgi:hypothetical protein
MVTIPSDSRRERGTLLELLHPRGQLRLLVALFSVGLALAWLGTWLLDLPTWAGAVLILALLLLPALRKWRSDLQVLGTPLTVLSILLVTQSLHTVEHLAQSVQYHLLGWPLKAASGLISPLNAEVVHFTWNWAVLLVVGYLVGAGVRTGWMWLLLGWAGAHTAEHTYLLVNYLATGGVQGLPGVLGKGGWLANNAAAVEPIAFVCRLAPGLTSAPRLDVHFWWNVGEISLLLTAALFLRGSPGWVSRRSSARFLTSVRLRRSK